MGSRSKRARHVATKSGPPPATEGLAPLDQNRAASLADEGGATAAAFETQEESDFEERSTAEKRSTVNEAKNGARRTR